ncbi:VOC family protein [Arthrobacter zhaoguopingii]|uniref:VOC family protein n=1 Tax=Arthrobacter zhaoguopingii TaxID=2681491 RepID=UPI00135901EA|nr:VOC family protein [Arthrobacter zhaoguopingii]
MAIQHVLAVVPVSDLAAARAWYERVLGTPPTNVPMPESLVEWRITGQGWVQVTLDPVRAGSGLLNFAVDDLNSHVAGLAAQGIEPDPVVTANRNVTLCSLQDPDGNTLTFIGNFRIDYSAPD